MARKSVAQHIVRAHPAILTVLQLALGMLVGRTAQLEVGIALTVLLLASVCGWSWAVFSVSTRGELGETQPGWRPWVYTVPPLMVSAAGLAGWSLSNSLSAFIAFAALFTGLWWAAKALEERNAVAGPPRIARVLATMLLMYFSFVGVWVLRPKIMKAAGSS